jgi:hypothetical protein
MKCRSFDVSPGGMNHTDPIQDRLCNTAVPIFERFFRDFSEQ